MGLSSDEVVEIQFGKKPDEPCIVTVSCPDKTGLGCDLCQIILEFGLCITRGDVSTDAQWCFVVLWVVPSSPNINIQWTSLKKRLLSACPTFSIPFYLETGSLPKTSQTYLLKLFSVDRKGLLHDVTHVLCELDLCIQRVKVSTTPDGRVMDLFFITDGMELLHTVRRQDEICHKLSSVLGDSCISCEIELAESFQQGFSSLPPAVATELFSFELSSSQTCPQGLLGSDLSKISYGRFMSDTNGYREIDLFIQQTDGKKIVDPEKQDALCSRLKLEMLHPLRVIVVSRGPDTELLVANSVELCGKGRPRVFYDVTLALKMLGICIFSAEIGKHTTADKQWEVYRFLLEEMRELPLSNRRTRNQIVERVMRTLMGW
ncbi:hypothetical protein HPP92_006336 [Vanilla planifolia]|uniref:ACT domain-containing protein ACR n=1 Tax=Vanilla planifolia TaxID=51239 RepID=A0A835V9J4_VANPL|nr:hypothetical protein HPP92_006336 [Vanilla planifolia]